MRMHPERHDPARPCRDDGFVERGHQRVIPLDHRVGRHHPYDCAGIALGDHDRRRRDRRGGVAADRLEHDGGVFDTARPHLLGNQEPVFLIADDDRGAERWADAAADRLLQHGAFADQRPELLRKALARHRPKAGTGTAGQDDGHDHAVIGTGVGPVDGHRDVHGTSRGASRRRYMLHRNIMSSFPRIGFFVTSIATKLVSGNDRQPSRPSSRKLSHRPFPMIT